MLVRPRLPHPERQPHKRENAKGVATAGAITTQQMKMEALGAATVQVEKLGWYHKEGLL